MSKQAMSFEQALQRLEEIAEQLEQGNVPLEDTMSLFQEANELNTFCLEKLNTAEKKLHVLTKKDNDFELKLEEHV